MSNVPLAIRQKLEAAVQAYLQSCVLADPGSALAGVPINLRQEITKRVFPRVVVECVDAPAYEDMNELYMANLKVYVGTLATETDSVGRHGKRTGLLSEWLANRAAITAFVNSPSCPVQGLSLCDCLLEQETGEQTGEHWIDVLDYLTPCQLLTGQ